MFGRPIPIWLILAYLGYGVLGTVRNLGAMLSGTQNYSIYSTVFSVVVAALSLWLIAEIWVRGSRVLWLAGVNAVVVIVGYGIIMFPVFLTGDQQQVIALSVMIAIMAAIWGSIYLYLRRYTAPK